MTDLKPRITDQPGRTAVRRAQVTRGLPIALLVLSLLAASCGGAASTEPASTAPASTAPASTPPASTPPASTAPTPGGPTSSEPAAAEPVQVTGTETCEDYPIRPLEVRAECVDTTSDPRVSGEATAYVFLEQEGRPTDMSGTFKLVNEGGTWEGDWSGEITADGNHLIDGVLDGDGDYAGLRYRVHWEGTESLTITGTIEPVS